MPEPARRAGEQEETDRGMDGGKEGVCGLCLDCRRGPLKGFNLKGQNPAAQVWNRDPHTLIFGWTELVKFPTRSNSLIYIEILHITMLEMSFCAFKNNLPLRLQSFFLKKKEPYHFRDIFCLNHAEQKQM